MQKLFVSYYTKGYYKEIADKYLIPSLRKFDLCYYTEEKKDKGSWLKNGKLKSQFIYDMLLLTNRDVIWLDADAEIIQFPNLLYNMEDNINVGVHYLDWYKFWHNQSNKNKLELLGGTIYFKNNKETLQLVDEWNKLNKANTIWGQQLLSQLLSKYSNLKVYSLPIEYCQIIKKGGIIPNNTIIAQHQASRETKNKN